MSELDTCCRRISRRREMLIEVSGVNVSSFLSTHLHDRSLGTVQPIVDMTHNHIMCDTAWISVCFPRVLTLAPLDRRQLTLHAMQMRVLRQCAYHTVQIVNHASREPSTIVLYKTIQG